MKAVSDRLFSRPIDCSVESGSHVVEHDDRGRVAAEELAGERVELEDGELHLMRLRLELELEAADHPGEEVVERGRDGADDESQHAIEQREEHDRADAEERADECGDACQPCSAAMPAIPAPTSAKIAKMPPKMRPIEPYITPEILAAEPMPMRLRVMSVPFRRKSYPVSLPERRRQIAVLARRRART